MGKRKGRIAGLATLLTAGALCLGSTTVWAQAINVGSVSGEAGTQVSISATLSVGTVTPGVAGSQNDITYDNTKVQVPLKRTCSDTTDQICSVDGDCPSGETCVDAGPDCAVNSAIKKDATQFGFLPTNCVGAACNGVRIILFGITSSQANRLIADGATLYTCKVNILANATGTATLTVSNVVLGLPTPPGGQACGSTPACGAGNGTITIGGAPTTPPSGPTPTPTISGAGIIGDSTADATAPGSTTFSVHLSAPGVTPGVAGSQNDVTYDPTKVQIPLKRTCSDTSTQTCSVDADCPSGETCVDAGPDCTVNSAIKKDATQFGFLPTNCTGSACNGVRVILFGITSSQANRLIADGATLYTCKVNVLAGASGEALFTISNVVLGFPTPPGGQLCGSTETPCGALPGRICVGPCGGGGPIQPTNTPTTTPTTTNSPTVAPTNTRTATLSPTATRTTVPPTSAGGGITEEDGCQIGTKGSAGSAWLLVIPAVGLLALRRKRR